MRRPAGAGAALRHSLHAAWRHLVVGTLLLVPGVPRSRRRRVERRLRGREEQRKIAEAEVLLVSFGKSGRTWIRLMLSRFYQKRFGLPAGSFLEYDNLHRLDPAIPRVFFTHGNYLRDYTGHWDHKCDFHGKRIVLLVRDPRDVAVSQYFQWKNRMHPHKKWLNDYPPHGAAISLFDFVAWHPAGLTRMIEFLNLWSAELSHLEEVLVVRYEDMRRDPHAALGRILGFLGTPPQAEELRDAVDFAAFDNMRRLEQEGGVRARGRRLVPGRGGSHDAYKVRRAKVGGWRDYFDPAQQALLDARVAAELSPGFGYTPAETEGGAPGGAGEGRCSSSATV